MSFTFRDLFSEEDAGELPPEPGQAPHREESNTAGARDEEPPGRKADSGRRVSFQVSELLPFIPPAISAKSGIPMEKEVQVPISEDGSHEVRLSTLYSVCPELFAAEITPMNDSVVPLPARLGASSGNEGSSAASFQPPASEAAAPTRDGEEELSTASPGANPFWTQAGEKPGSENEETTQTGLASLETLSQSLGDSSGKARIAGWDSRPAEPVSKQGDDEAEGSCFDIPGPLPSGSPASSGESSGESDGGGTFGFESGEEAGNTNPFDSSEGFATLFSKEAEKDAGIPFPETDESRSELFGGGWSDPAPKSSPAGPESSPVAPAESPAAESSPAEPPSGRAPSQEASAMPAPTGETPPASDPFAGFAAPKASEAPGSGTPEAPEAREKLMPEESPDDSPSAEAPNPSSEDAPASVQEFAPVPRPEAEPVGEPVTAPTTGSEGAAASEEDESLRDLEFRAIFSSSDPFTLSEVARRVVGLEGIQGCALATPTKLVQATKSEQQRLGEEAREMVESIRNLARLSGLPEAKFFTLRTDQGMVSLFLEGDCCVTVTHDGGEFGPGVREKLILIARSIHKLSE